MKILLFTFLLFLSACGGQSDQSGPTYGNEHPRCFDRRTSSITICPEGSWQ